ncbi:MAG TPA: YdeI/OmpD-associated family protein [Longimicrobium sp.]|nr:YdeI/OmpD-associated family protein [Longimicrobium sp.]
MEPHFFATPEEFRAWLQASHATAGELWVGFYKVGTGRPSITWPQSVDEALSFGWIDGIRKRIDDESYVIRFTPRRTGSIWSAVNIKRMGELIAEGRVHPAGLAAFEKRRDDKSAIYSYEQKKTAELPEEYEHRFRENAAAWKFFQSQAPWYRRNTAHWVISAKKEETREKRLATLIADSAAGRRIRGVIDSGKETKGE